MIFDRQVLFWGQAKQACLEQATVFVAGLGGLGCLLSELLVRAGVGKLYVCDRGVVDEPDLNRQLFYTQSDVGKKKVAVAAQWLRSIHGRTSIVALDEDLRAPRFALPEDIDGVADCLDNFDARLAVWEKLNEGKFFVHAGVEQFFGQVVTAIKGQGPGFAEIFANASRAPRVIPVSGASAAVLSALQANEVLNNLFKEPRLLATLLIVDLSDFTFNKVQLKAGPGQ
jgi:molybdopterin synthase catalytic subunit